MKESGINYFFNYLNLYTGGWNILYTFETGIGYTSSNNTVINSISGAQSIYSGLLQNTGNFWQKPGSGYFTGAPISIQNASGLFSNAWTMVFAYEKTTNFGGVLFSCLSGTSGFQIGITDTNKPYFQTNNGTYPLTVSSLNNYGSKNLIAFSYVYNSLNIENYNFTSQQIEQENFNYNFNLTQSNTWTLGPSWTGYMDYFIYFSQYYSSNTLSTFFSGFYNYPTGTGYNIQTVSVTGVITGFQNVLVVNTGITGYINIYDTGSGYSDYTGIFPTGVTTSGLTGVLNTGLFASGITGTLFYNVTGSQITLFEVLSGYVSTFGMDKIQLYGYIQNTDVIKSSFSYTPYDFNYNIFAVPGYSGFYLNTTNFLYSGNQINMFLNGIAQANQGWFLSGNNLLMTGVNNSDILFIDNKVGNQNVFAVTGGNLAFPFNYSGQEIFLNGVNLISGLTFISTGTGITLTGNATGITGYVFEYPIVLVFNTGNYSLLSGQKFDRDSSNVYLNGVRQGNGIDYIEGSVWDMLSGNYFNNTQNYQTIIYNDNNNYWISQ